LRQAGDFLRFPTSIQFKNRDDVTEILLTVTLNTIILTPITENLYKMISDGTTGSMTFDCHWTGKWSRDDIFCFLLFFEIHRRCP